MTLVYQRTTGDASTAQRLKGSLQLESATAYNPNSRPHKVQYGGVNFGDINTNTLFNILYIFSLLVRYSSSSGYYYHGRYYSSGWSLLYCRLGERSAVPLWGTRVCVVSVSVNIDQLFGLGSSASRSQGSSAFRSQGTSAFWSRFIRFSVTRIIGFSV